MENTSFNITAVSAPVLISAMPDGKSTALKHQIVTERLFMRPVNESDFIEYVELLSDAAVMKFIGAEAGEIPRFQDIVRLHENAVKRWETHGFGRWSVFDRATGEFVGFSGFRSEKGEPELICAMHEKFWGRGLAIEAATACIDYGFESLGITSVKAITRPNNNRARRLLEKMNAKFLGCINFYGIEGATYLIMPKTFSQ